jgi:predicted negative regulator of RcsB-dependent stress response
MTRRDKIGLGIVIALLLVLLGVLVWTRWGERKTAHSPSESFVVKQRIINLQKSK